MSTRSELTNHSSIAPAKRGACPHLSAACGVSNSWDEGTRLMILGTVHDQHGFPSRPSPAGPDWYTPPLKIALVCRRWLPVSSSFESPNTSRFEPHLDVPRSSPVNSSIAPSRSTTLVGSNHSPGPYRTPTWDPSSDESPSSCPRQFDRLRRTTWRSRARTQRKPTLTPFASSSNPAPASFESRSRPSRPPRPSSSPTYRPLPSLRLPTCITSVSNPSRPSSYRVRSPKTSGRESLRRTFEARCSV